MGCTAALWAGLELPVKPLTPVLTEPDLDVEVDRLLAELPARFALAGLSLGAIVAMALVRRAPIRVTRLCLLSTNARGPTEAQQAGWGEQRRTLAAGSARALQEGLLPVLLSPTAPTRRPGLVATTPQMAEDLGTEGYDPPLRLQSTRIDERPGLASVRCPTLVLAAAEDRLCGLDRHEEIAGLVPGAELVVLEDAAHLSPLEQPVAVTRHLCRWLGR